jgi:sulfur carrier protein
MRIELNGENTEIRDDATVATLVEAQALAGRRIAVELNGEIVPRSRHGERRLKDGDRVEIVHAVGGG